jgi:hypothetical protein
MRFKISIRSVHAGFACTDLFLLLHFRILEMGEAGCGRRF